MKIEIAAQSDVGMVRNVNQDNLFFSGMKENEVLRLPYEYEGLQEIKSDCAYAVFDGMGGLKHGEEAACTAGRRLAGIMSDWEKLSHEDIIYELNTAVCERKKEFHVSLGTTAAILFLSMDEAVSVNVGDSRVYHFGDGKLKQLSKDHTAYNSALNMKKEMGDACNIDLAMVSNALTQYLGVEEEEFLLEPEIKRITNLQQGDIFLICSDGLWNEVSDEEIKEILAGEEGVTDKAKRLKNSALEAGGRDNVTVLLIQIKEI